MIAHIANREQSAHLTPQIEPVPAEFSLTADSLPYEKLGGPGFERLCYLLLLTRGHSPVFFGTSGQAQRGIDLLVEEDGERVVYQCKNQKNFSAPDMIAALQKFESEWLHQSDLPKPRRFVLCLSRSLLDVKDLEPWETYQDEFSKTHQVQVGMPWDRPYLDETLKQRPDIVAEIFSDQLAELFCERDDWAYDQFHPLVINATEPSLKRYFERKTDGRLYFDPERVTEFTKKIESNGSVLIKGLPGSGKTITSLALADQLEGYRTYYVSLREEISNDTLVKGIKDRLSRRTIFVLDDCQGKLGKLGSLMIRIRRLLQGPLSNQALFVFLTRTIPTPDNLPSGDEITAIEEDLRQADAVITFEPDLQTFRHIVEKSRPGFIDLADDRLENLYDLTGHDLFLVDELLDTLVEGGDLDDVNLEFLFKETVKRYFGNREAVYRPGFTYLAALGQLDLAPRIEGFPYDLKAEDPGAMQELVATAGHPPHYFFLHSSAAELVFRALTRNDGVTDHTTKTAEHLIHFFKVRALNDPTLAEDLSKAVRNHLKLTDEAGEERWKSIFLTDDSIYELIDRNFAELPPDLLIVCRKILRNENSRMLIRYEDLVRHKIEDGTVLQLAAAQPSWDASLFLRFTKRYYPELLEPLRNQIETTVLGPLMQTMELATFVALLSAVVQPDEVKWRDLLSVIPEGEIEAMFVRTITTRESIGTLSRTLGELKKSDEILLRRLEERISAPHYLRLIVANGTLFELFRVIGHSTFEFAVEMIAALDDQLTEQLIARTIESGRSISTLHLTLRGLKDTEETLLRNLEEKIGALHHLRLIAANGTLFELFMLLKDSTLEFAEEMIAALDDELTEQLIARTITSGRSIATLHLTLRELKESDGTLLSSLEEKIGAPRLLRLIAANGTLFELFMMIMNSSLVVAEEMIADLDDQLIELLIARTITSGRSIGTLDLALRELKETDSELLRRLEEKISARRLLRLIVANGTLFELFRAIQHSTLEFAEDMIAALDHQLIEQLTERTISTGRSIGTLHLTLRYLKRTNGTLLRQLEEKIGVNNWWRIVCSFGSVAILAGLLPAMGKSMRQRMIEAARRLSEEDWKHLLRQNGFYELSYFLKHVPYFFSNGFRPNFLKPILVSIIQSSKWESLNFGWWALSNAPDSAGKRFLLKLLLEQLHDIEPETLNFFSFAEASSSVTLLWRLLPGKRNDWARVLWEFVNTSQTVYADSSFLRSTRLLFSTLVLVHAPAADLRMALSLGNDVRVAKLWPKAATLDQLLYLWNLFALWFECKTSGESFGEFLNVELKNALITSFNDRLSAGSDQQQAENLIELAGALSFFGVLYEHSPLIDRFLSKLPSLDEMIFSLEPRLSFIPSVFFLLGVEWLFQEEGSVPPIVWREHLVKANRYTETTAALEHLVSLARSKSRVA